MRVFISGSESWSDVSSLEGPEVVLVVVVNAGAMHRLFAECSDSMSNSEKASREVLPWKLSTTSAKAWGGLSGGEVVGLEGTLGGEEETKSMTSGMVGREGSPLALALGC